MTFLNIKQQIAYIHIPKTAGRSISQLLNSSSYKNDLRYPVLDFFNLSRLNGVLPYWYFPRLNGLSKLRALEVLYGGHLSRSEIESMLVMDFKYYSVVRNPFEIMVSSYEYIKSSKRNSYKNSFTGCLGTFDDYVRQSVKAGFSQFEYLSDSNGKLSNLNIGHFEDIKSFLPDVIKGFDVAGISLEHLNKSGRSVSSYRKYYSDSLRKFVEVSARRDLDAFGYSYDDLD